ncbi:hypothetical protein NDU88_003078 [Pleurodeles waltl]|uniref:Uncharacterized protein n=1 Tax=Pleurodeles waltl TaxID=8319 RepID=A0AAV7MXH6_PLEWA|nr:hypothetical protein NDU88_003078 [Pleurodeles waltl]
MAPPHGPQGTCVTPKPSKTRGRQESPAPGPGLRLTLPQRPAARPSHRPGPTGAKHQGASTRSQRSCCQTPRPDRGAQRRKDRKGHPSRHSPALALAARQASAAEARAHRAPRQDLLHRVAQAEHVLRHRTGVSPSACSLPGLPHAAPGKYDEAGSRSARIKQRLSPLHGRASRGHVPDLNNGC